MIVFIGGVDYVAFDEVIDLQAGTTGFTYNVTIRSNPAVEPTETFNAIISFVSEAALLVTQNTATVQIADVNGLSYNSYTSTRSYFTNFLSEVTIGFDKDNYIIDENIGYITITCIASGPVFTNVTLNIHDSPNTAQSQLSIYYNISLHHIYYQSLMTILDLIRT